MCMGYGSYLYNTYNNITYTSYTGVQDKLHYNFAYCDLGFISVIVTNVTILVYIVSILVYKSNIIL